jgi:acetylornithine deacetylase
MTKTIEYLDRLVSFKTVSALSNLDLISYIETFLTERGFRLSRLPDATGTKTGLVASIGPDNGGVVLSGHTDVVPVDGQDWTKDPFALTRDGDRLYGRGTTDMKGYLACMLYAADRATRITLKKPLTLVFSYDEEIGCVGIQHMLDDLSPMLGSPVMCLVGEPTGMQIAVGHKGKAAIRATCSGQNGHSALAPKFVNALHLACDFTAQLRHIQDQLSISGARDDAYDIPFSTVHVGAISGGKALNIVPHEAEIIFEYRHLADDDPEEIFAKISQAASDAALEYKSKWSGANIQLERYNTYPALSVPHDDSVVAIAQNVARTNSTIKVPFGTEAGLFTRIGIPTVVCGPGSMEGQGHKPDEYIEIAQLKACENMMDRVLGLLT